MSDKRKRTTVRCAYIEGKQRCRRNGTGNPPLCEPHRVTLEAEAARPATPGEKFANLLRRVMGGQRVTYRDIHSGLDDFVDVLSASQAAQRAPTGAVPPGRQPRTQQRRTWSPPPPPARPAPNPQIEAARRVLGFAPGQRLTVEDVKKRQRDLARRHHPDRGGSLAKMQEVNAAVDQLLETL